MEENNQNITEPFNPFYKSYNIPSSDVVLSAQLKPKKSRLKYLTIFLFLTFLVSGFAFAYFYFIKTNESIKIENKVTQVEEKNLSEEEVEAKNLQSIQKSPKNLADLYSYSEINPEVISSLDLDSEITMLYLSSNESAGILTVNKIENIDKVIVESNLKKFTPKIEFDYKKGYDTKSLNSAMIDKHVIDILTSLEGIDYDGIEVSYTYMVFDGYYDFLEKLKTSLAENNKKLYVSVLPKWGDSVDYNKYINFYKSEFFNIDYLTLSNSADQIRVNAFDYTTVNSTLAGPISPKNWVEQVIRFMISKNVPREKIILGINTRSYEWSSRDFVENYYENYIWTEKEISNAYSFEQVENLLEELKGYKEYPSNNEKVIEYTKDDENYILVIATSDFINSIKSLSSDYGLGGFFLR